MTELEAVNIILQIAGESTVDSLDVNDSYETDQVQSVLNEAVYRICNDSQVFNTEHSVTLSATAGQIPIETGVISFIPDSGQYSVTIRNGYLYDLNEGSTQVPYDTITGTKIYLLDFAELPETGKRYATTMASRIFVSRYVGSQSVVGYTQQDELEAKAAFMEQMQREGRINMLTDSYSVVKTILRGQQRRTNINRLTF